MTSGSHRLPVIVNRSGGTAAHRGGALGGEIEAAFDGAGVGIELHLVRGTEVADAVRRYRDAPTIVVGGGDGTLGCAAGVLAGSATALGILPLGTRNHLARELGIPLDLDGAARCIGDGHRRAIDLGEVGGRTFVNNASVGLYPSLVRLRDAEQEERALPKWAAAIPASYAALKRMRHHRMRLSGPDGTAEIVTPMLFVGNNRYELARGRFGQRQALDDGCLSVFAVASRRRSALIGFALRALAGAIRDDDFAAIGDTAELDVRGSSAAIDIALDGEVVRLPMPLHFAIRPGALTVIAPA